jgi:GH25 family lysozyme M1 (1,4-beta-N-acetylmuramidase)
MTSRGCDVASYQGQIDFDALKADVSFIFAKATEGTGYRDPTFGRNWSEAKRVGLTRGAYHFARPDLGLSAPDEAGYFLANLGPLEPGDELALDYEVQFHGDVVGWCKQFLDRVREIAGRPPYVYLNMSLVRGHDWSSVIEGGYPLWLAFYDGDPAAIPVTPWPAVAIKQWTSSGFVAGIGGRVDLNTRFAELEEDVTPEEAKQIAEKAIIDAGLDPNTVELIKKKINRHVHLPGAIQTTVPLDPPAADVVYAGSSADFSQTFWLYPDGVVRNQNGDPRP